MTITYTQIGDYLLPNLAPSESPKVGRWGMLRFNYLPWIGISICCPGSTRQSAI